MGPRASRKPAWPASWRRVSSSCTCLADAGGPDCLPNVMAASLAEVAMESQQEGRPPNPDEIREARKGSVDAHRGLDMVRRSTGSPKRPGQGRWHSSGTPQAPSFLLITQDHAY